MVNKWERRPEDAVTNTPDDKITDMFHKAFTEPLSSSKREAMSELFPMRGARRNVSVKLTC